MIKEHIEGAYIMLYRKLKEKDVPDLEKIGLFVNYYKQLGGDKIDTCNLKCEIDPTLQIPSIRVRYNSWHLAKEFVDTLQSLTPSQIYSLYLRSSFEVPERFAVGTFYFNVSNFLNNYKL